MGKSYNRRFRKNGLSFIVQDTHPADRKSDTPVRLLPVAAIKTSWTQSLQPKAGLSTHIKQYNAVFAP